MTDMILSVVNGLCPLWWLYMVSMVTTHRHDGGFVSLETSLCLIQLPIRSGLTLAHYGLPLGVRL
jgi:hypothetical protein